MVVFVFKEAVAMPFLPKFWVVAELSPMSVDGLKFTIGMKER